ncbi:MAG: endonuclease III [Firmicutes bacterium]|nr:endonuclease III [Bacillota bacterium]
MQKIERVVEYLHELYPEPECELKFNSEFEMFVAVLLSPQCTDKRVNMVTKELFKTANTPEQVLAMGQTELEKRIYSTGFYKNKAKNLILSSQMLLQEFGGKLPKEVEQLVQLPGAGRKVANVIAALAHGANTFAVDTHVFRVTNRLGLVKAKTPDETERKFVAKYSKYITPDLHLSLVLFGRYICTAKNPKCAECRLRDVCDGQNSPLR